MKKQGYLKRNGFKTWYVIHEPNKPGTPLIVVHGGPGFPHNAQNNTAQLAQSDYPVILYDQLGCGLSDKPNDKSLWTVDFFVEELEELRKHLGHKQINLMGQSWGGSLILEYVYKYPKNANKLIIHSPLIDTKLWVDEADKLKDQLPDNLGKRMRELETSDEWESEEYSKLSKIFSEHFVCRLKPWPKDLVDCEKGAGLQVYRTMWGPGEAFATGNLKNWSIVKRLKDIKHTSLLISGKYDEATPKQMKIIVDKMPNVTWELFDSSAHCANLEEPEKFTSVVGDFLSA